MSHASTRGCHSTARLRPILRAVPEIRNLKIWRYAFHVQALSFVGLLAAVLIAVAACGQSAGVPSASAPRTPVVLTTAQPTDTNDPLATQSPIQVTKVFQLTINGTVMVGDSFQLYFQPGHVGQDLFGFCDSGIGPPCEGNGKAFARTFGGLIPGRATYRFERVDAGGHVTVISSGEDPLTSSSTIRGSYTYP